MKTKRGLKHLSCEDREFGQSSLEKRKCQGDLVKAFQYIKEAYSDMTRASSCKLKEEGLRVKKGRNFDSEDPETVEPAAQRGCEYTTTANVQGQVGQGFEQLGQVGSGREGKLDDL